MVHSARQQRADQRLIFSTQATIQIFDLRRKGRRLEAGRLTTFLAKS
jgi:hypothetical protein